MDQDEMDCLKCKKKYPSRYYFTTKYICKDCYAKLTDEEKEKWNKYNEEHNQEKLSILKQGEEKKFLDPVKWSFKSIILDVLNALLVGIGFYNLCAFFSPPLNFRCNDGCATGWNDPNCLIWAGIIIVFASFPFFFLT